MAAALILACGCARSDWIQQILVTSDVTGTWQTTEGELIELKLEQQGAKVTGSIVALGRGARNSGVIEGAVGGDVFQFKQVGGVLMPLQGETTVSGDEMHGTVRAGTAAGQRQIFLRRVSPSSE